MNTRNYLRLRKHWNCIFLSLRFHTNKICVLALLLHSGLLSASIATQHISLHIHLISSMLLFTLITGVRIKLEKAWRKNSNFYSDQYTQISSKDSKFNKPIWQGGSGVLFVCGCWCIGLSFFESAPIMTFFNSFNFLSCFSFCGNILT